MAGMEKEEKVIGKLKEDIVYVSARGRAPFAKKGDPVSIIGESGSMWIIETSGGEAIFCSKDKVQIKIE